MRLPWNKRDLEFVDSTRSVYHHFPIQRAKDVKPRNFALQKAKYNQFKFPFCPGMIDYAQLGYIIPAWVDVHIMANKAGVVSTIGSAERGSHGFRPPERMATDITDGLLVPADDVPLTILKYDCPWKVFAHGSISALLVPAWYHSDFLDDLHIWPGAVDYKKFHTANVILSPKRKCQIHIKAGDPFLQVIPFWNKDIVAGYGPGTDIQLDATKNSMPTDESQYYRKKQMVNKVFNLFRSEKTDD